MEARDLRRMTVDAYLELEMKESSQKWEYVNGEAFAMAGGSQAHAQVVGSLIVELRSALKGRPCHARPEAQKVATVRTQAYHFPDASVVCPPFAADAKDKHAVTSPVALFEVLSPGTRDYDRGEKFEHYRTIDALEDYVLIDPETRQVEHRKRVGPNQWLSTWMTDGDVKLESLGVALPIGALWDGLDALASVGAS
jgi:Uma2 family endonuclease